MPPVPPEVVTFTADDRTEIVAAMRRLIDGSGWINLEPDAEVDEGPASSLFRLFSTHGRPLPLCTWSPSPPSKRERSVSIGIDHGVGRKAVPVLAEAGVTPGNGWRLLQDNAKRGLVVSVPIETDQDVVLRWLLQAGETLCPVTFERWVAGIYTRR